MSNRKINNRLEKKIKLLEEIKKLQVEERTASRSVDRVFAAREIDIAFKKIGKIDKELSDLGYVSSV